MILAGLNPAFRRTESVHPLKGFLIRREWPELAEREGFEPPVPCGTTVFKTAAFDHSATSPCPGRARKAIRGRGPNYRTIFSKQWQKENLKLLKSGIINPYLREVTSIDNTEIFHHD